MYAKNKLFVKCLYNRHDQQSHRPPNITETCIESGVYKLVDTITGDWFIISYTPEEFSDRATIWHWNQRRKITKYEQISFIEFNEITPNLNSAICSVFGELITSKVHVHQNVYNEERDYIKFSNRSFWDYYHETQRDYDKTMELYKKDYKQHIYNFY